MVREAVNEEKFIIKTCYNGREMTMAVKKSLSLRQALLLA